MQKILKKKRVRDTVFFPLEFDIMKRLTFPCSTKLTLTLSLTLSLSPSLPLSLSPLLLAPSISFPFVSIATGIAGFIHCRHLILPLFIYIYTFSSRFWIHLTYRIFITKSVDGNNK